MPYLCNAIHIVVPVPTTSFPGSLIFPIRDPGNEVAGSITLYRITASVSNDKEIGLEKTRIRTSSLKEKVVKVVLEIIQSAYDCAFRREVECQQ